MSSRSYILSNLWNGIENGEAWDASIVFNRTNPLPLDKFSVFNSFQSAHDYALTSPVAYPGQLITVVDNETSAVSVYKVEVGGNITEIGSGGGGDISVSFGSGLQKSQDGVVSVKPNKGIEFGETYGVQVKLGDYLVFDQNNSVTLSDLALDCGDS